MFVTKQDATISRNALESLLLWQEHKQAGRVSHGFRFFKVSTNIWQHSHTGGPTSPAPISCRKGSARLYRSRRTCPCPCKVMPSQKASKLRKLLLGHRPGSAPTPSAAACSLSMSNAACLTKRTKISFAVPVLGASCSTPGIRTSFASSALMASAEASAPG